MKKAKKMLAVMGCAAMLLSGCTQSNIVTPSGGSCRTGFFYKRRCADCLGTGL